MSDELSRLEAATAALQPPFAIVDLDAFWANAADMERRAVGKHIRLASKSVRCRFLQERVLERQGFQGTLAYTLPEALWLAGHGLNDILVAYPTADSQALHTLAELSAERPQTKITIMVDGLEQLDLLDAAAGVPGGGRRAPVRVCIDIDAGWRALGGRLRVGAKRSPVHTPEQAGSLAKEILDRAGVKLVGVMAYEAQIAGLGDAPVGRPLRALAIRTLQARSGKELAVRRAQVVAAVEAEIGAVSDSATSTAADAPARLEFVNGGGTGSLEATGSEDAVTELGAGSGLYGPGLFDSYRAFKPKPAALFALPIVRKPSQALATALGGGYLASGPGDGARLPKPYLPAGLSLDGQEGAGEVQTPLLGQAASKLDVGDRVWFRHAKAGELCERFNSLHLIEGERIVEEVPTYRGEGQCFL